ALPKLQRRPLARARTAPACPPTAPRLRRTTAAAAADRATASAGTTPASAPATARARRTGVPAFPQPTVARETRATSPAPGASHRPTRRSTRRWPWLRQPRVRQPPSLAARLPPERGALR